MAIDTGTQHLHKEVVKTGDGDYTVFTPGWGEWLKALERATGPEGTVDTKLIMEECLLSCLSGSEGSIIKIEDLQSLSARDGDRLIQTALRLMDEQLKELNLNLHVETSGKSAKLTGNGLHLKLCQWSFGERNEALRHSIRLKDGRVSIDLGTYELMMVIGCTSTVEGHRVEYEKVVLWPVPLGETVVQVLEQINGLEDDYIDILNACHKFGLEHPDLAMFEICHAFGWPPEQVEQMDARLAQRLLAWLRTVRGPNQPVTRTNPAQEEGVTRIIVQND